MLHRRRHVLVGSLLAAVVVLAACTQDTQDPGGDGQDEASPTTERNGPVGPVPDGLRSFYGQALTWEDCSAYADSFSAEQALGGAQGVECSTVTVPLDYSRPEGTTIEIGVLRHRASEPDRRIGALLMNPGGPGVAGVPRAAQTATQNQDSRLAKRFDLIGFDPRGVGSSKPQINCLTDEERDAERAEDDEADTSPRGVAKQEADARAFGRKCAQRTTHGKQMLAHVGTREVVQDMDVLRSALGEKKLNYLGYSYGTRIGTAYAEQFPGRVRSLVLDGAVDPTQGPAEAGVKQAAGFQQAFEEFTGWCTARQDCALGQDREQALTRFQDLVQPLVDRPVETGDGRKLSFDDATTAAAQAMYNKQLWEPLNSALNELDRNRGGAMMRLADLYNERGPDGNYSSTQDATVAIRCVDQEPVTDRDKLRSTARRATRAAPFLDDGSPVAGIRGPCAFWPVDNTSKAHLPDVGDIPPALVISTTNDPATPYQAGVRLAEVLDGRLLTFEGNQHTVYLQGNQCVDEVGTDYLIDGTLPPEDKRCP